MSKRYAFFVRAEIRRAGQEPEHWGLGVESFAGLTPTQIEAEIDDVLRKLRAKVNERLRVRSEELQ